MKKNILNFPHSNSEESDMEELDQVDKEATSVNPLVSPSTKKRKSKQVKKLQQ